MEQRLIKLRELCALTQLSKPTIYRLMAEGNFPRPMRLSKHRVAWRVKDIELWIADLSQAGGASNG